MKSACFCITLLLSNLASAQSSDSLDWEIPINESRELGLMMGIHQFSTTYLELGISRIKSRGGCVWGSYFHGTSLSGEYNPFHNKFGVTLSAWISLATFIIVGANINSYSDLEKYNLGVKPFIGIGPGNFSLTYGYNFQIIDNDLRHINNHTLSLRFHLRIKEISK